MRRIFLLCTIFLFSVLTPIAQSPDCEGLVGDLPAMTVGLVYPSDNFLTPNRIEYYQGAMAMLETVKACDEDVQIEWVQAFAEDYEEALTATQELVMNNNIKLIIGGGSEAISQGLADAASNFNIIFWETTDGLSTGGQHAFSATSSNFQRGLTVGDFIRQQYGNDATVALIYNTRERASGIAEGVRYVLEDNILIENAHEQTIPSPKELALSIRQQGIDVVVLITFQTTADSLWLAMREADANVRGWLNVGDPGYRFGLCVRIGETHGLITMHRFAMTNPTNDMFDVFAKNYQEKYGKFPSERAHLTASGVYLLLNHVLTQVGDNPSVEALREAILGATAEIGDGLMGEGLQISTRSGSNELASLVVQQNQNGQFCTAFPSALATCESVEDFSTWRDRAIMQDEKGCTEPWADPDL